MTFNPRSVAEFYELLPDETAAVTTYAKLRWPDGPCCGDCGSHDVCEISTRPGTYQCREGDCRGQTSVRSGSVIHRTRIPVRDFLFIAWRCSTPAGASARSIARELGYRYATVWRLAHKIRASMAERGGWRIAGLAGLATASIPAPKVAKGDPEDRPPVAIGIAAAEEPGAPPVDLVRFVVGELDQTDAALVEHTRDLVEPTAEVQVAPTRLLRPWSRASDQVMEIHAQLRRWLRNRFGGVSRKYMANYLAQFAYVHNRCHDPTRLFEWVVRRVGKEPWRSEAQLVLAAP